MRSFAEVSSIVNKDIGLRCLELVKDVFVFSCFTGIAYIDVSNLTPDNKKDIFL